MQGLQRVKRQWRERWKALRSAPAGERFERSYREQQRADKGRSRAVRWLRPAFAFLSFAVGVLLAFIPGPAVLFFAISAALIASLSLRFARALDRFELWVRATWASFKAWRRGSRHAH